MTYPPHILIIRLSALGDVAMTVPVVRQLAAQYPQLKITILSRPFARALYAGMPANVHFMEADLKGKHKGVKGLNELFRRLHAKHFTAVADLHDVLRTKYLRLRFHINRYPIAHIDKHRQQRRQLVRQHNKQLHQLPTQFQNYADVFAKLGYPITLHTHATQTGNNSVDIGIAPFAAHKGKIYPTHLMQQVVEQLNNNTSIQHIYFFCGKGEETNIVNRWCSQYPKCTNASQQLHSLEKEIELMAQLRLLITMDSGNAHLAAMAGTEVVSIWGATHPYAGFKAYTQKEENILQTSLPCRPCSIYGNKPCLRKDYACLNNITPQQIVDKVMQIVGE